MKTKHTIAILVVYAAVLIWDCGSVFAQDIKQTENAVVRIIVPDKKWGTGCIIKVDKKKKIAYILTAYHVIKECKQVQVVFYVDGKKSMTTEAEVNSQWVWESGDFLLGDVAVLTVNDYPQNPELPVIFMDDISETNNLDLVRTIGYDELGDPQRAVGPISSLRSARLCYGANIVRPGFSGGPVFNQEGFMIGMNANLNELHNEIFAFRARVFKSVVAFLGLPRMRLEVSIDEPIGARDGVVSTEQEFTIKASVREDEEGNLMAPKVQLTLNVPEGYQIEEADKMMTVSLHHPEVRWRVKAPEAAKDEQEITVYTTPEATALLKPIRITTVRAAALKTEIITPKSHGQTLFVGQRLKVQAVVKNSGDAKLKEAGTLNIAFQPYEFELVDERTGSPLLVNQPINLVVDEPVNWKLKAKSKTESGNITVEIVSPGKDENDMRVKVIDPSALIFVEVKDIERWRTYVGVPTLLFGDRLAIEAEFGAKMYLRNILDRGIPLYVVPSIGIGIDRLNDRFVDFGGIDEETGEELRLFVESEGIFDEWHALGTVSLAAPIELVGVHAGVGWSFYSGLGEPGGNFNALHATAGIEVDLKPIIIQGSIRHVFGSTRDGGAFSLFAIQMKF